MRTHLLYLHHVLSRQLGTHWYSHGDSSVNTLLTTDGSLQANC